MHANPAFFILGALALSGGAALADNIINIRGSGGGRIHIKASSAANSLIDIYQVAAVPGTPNEAGTDPGPVQQEGSGHTARIGQGASYAGGVWTAGAAVAGNRASISQGGAGASYDTAAIYQATGGNSASVSQSGSGQSAAISQSGSAGNSAILSQSGAAPLAATILQNGTAASTLVASQAASGAYTLNVTQGGSGGHYAAIDTSGYTPGATLTVNQTGASNTAHVTGMSGGRASIDQSGTGGYARLENQSSGNLSVSQYGIDNAISIANYGTGASSGQPLSVVQTGLGLLTVTVFNPLIPPAGPTYSTAPPP